MNLGLWGSISPKTILGAIARGGGGAADTTAPTVEITSSESNGTTAVPIPITITFSEEVTGFVVGDITAAGCTLSNFATSDNIVFTVDATPTQSAVTIDIAAEVCEDGGGNPNTAATQFAISAAYTDAFTRADGAIANNWTGATWAIASNAVANTPTLGSEICVNGDMESWASASDLNTWTEAPGGTTTINQDGTDKHGGSYSVRYDVDASSSLTYIRQTLAAGADNQWLHWDFWAKGGTGKYVHPLIDGVGNIIPNDDFFEPGGTWTNYQMGYKSNTGNRQIRLYEGDHASESLWWDDMSIKVITASTISATRPQYPTADYVLEVDLTAHTGATFAGIIFALDNPANPQNYILAATNGRYLRLYKALSGVLSVVNTGAALLTTGNIRIAKSGTSVRVWHDDVLKIDTQTVSDAAIKDNTYAGIFSTYSGNTFDNWIETVRTAGGSTAYFDAFF